MIAEVLNPHSLAALPAAERILYCVGFDRAAGAAMRAVYVDGLENVLDRLNQLGVVERFVQASSTGVYGQTGGEWVDEDSAATPLSRVRQDRRRGRGMRSRLGQYSAVARCQ